MKKILSIAMVCMLALGALVSCNKDGGQNASVSTLKAGSSFNNSKTITFGDVTASLNGSNEYLLDGTAGPFKMLVHYFKFGKYTYSNGVYNLIGYGTIKLTKKENGKWKVEVKEEAVEGQPEPETVVYEDDEVEVNVPAQTQESSLLNQSWKIKKTIIKFKSATYDADGLNLNDLAAFAVKQGTAFSDEFPKDMVAEKVFISDSYVGIEFKNGQTYVSPVNMNGAALAGGKVNFNLSELGDAGVDFLNGEASLQFGANVAILSVNGGIGDEAVTASLTMEML